MMMPLISGRRAIFWIVMVAALGLASCSRDEQAEFDAALEAYSRGDFRTAMAKWRPLAEAGNTAAQTNIGVMYYQGRGVEPNYPEAVRWYKMAAAQRYPEALFNLGVAYADGKGVQKNMAEAVRWYRMAGESGYVPAQLVLGNVYARGTEVPVDMEEAARWYLAAAENGNGIAQLQVANIYAAGDRGFPRDLVKAHVWFTVASSNENEQVAAGGAGGMNRVAANMSQSQLAESERQSQTWLVQRAREEVRN